MTKKYYGYKNKYTYLCSMYLFNNEVKYEQVKNYIKNLRKLENDKTEIIFHVMNYLYVIVENELNQKGESELINDIAEYVKQDIDFFEIAKEFIEEFEE